MSIIGAPLIAIVACLGLAVDLHTDAVQKELTACAGKHDLVKLIKTKMEYLATSRPTAVNLFNALKEVEDKAVPAAEGGKDAMVKAVVDHAEFMLKRDVEDNIRIGKNGADALPTKDEGLTLMTICNTGSLATALRGTALGIVREVRDRGQLANIVALETRPYNQGSRLTAFELVEEKMPGATLICDSMASAYMHIKGVDGIVVGADRVCANGDTANKIGTYSLAVLAKYHNVPFYVASPFTTFDTSLKAGDEISIEERPACELLKTSNAPESVGVWNPAFDVTPAGLITGIVTENGVLYPEADGSFDVPGFIAKHQAIEASNGVASPTRNKLKIPPGYVEQTVQSLPHYLTKNAPKAMEILGTNNPEDLSCVEMGDGNLNLVFIVTNTKKSDVKKLIVKQSLPYVRCVGESWPLTLERAYFEYHALAAQKKACPDFVPSLYHFSKSNGLMVMEYLAPPVMILRKGLIQGIRYPTMARDMGTFCAQTLFGTSGFSLSASQLRKAVEEWSRNWEMCELTEQVVFTDPYVTADNNRWTSPQLDGDKKAIETNVALKEAAAYWKTRFVTDTQALLHGDLHSGSVMCAPADGQTFVIDPEFAFYGPMGFDTGAFVANLFLSYFSQAGHDETDDSYAEWVLEQVVTFWKTFESKFLTLWNDIGAHTGFLYGRDALGADLSDGRRQQFMARLLADTLGFAGMKMLRRIVGIAHVEDMDSIKDDDRRACCERRALKAAQIFIQKSQTTGDIATIEAAVAIAKEQ